MENIKSRLKNSDKNSMMLLLIAVLIFGIMQSWRLPPFLA